MSREEVDWVLQKCDGCGDEPASGSLTIAELRSAVAVWYVQPELLSGVGEASCSRAALRRPCYTTVGASGVHAIPTLNHAANNLRNLSQVHSHRRRLTYKGQIVYVRNTLSCAIYGAVVANENAQQMQVDEYELLSTWNAVSPHFSLMLLDNDVATLIPPALCACL